MKDALKQAKEQMAEALQLVKQDLKTIKTGRAKPSLVEDLKVKVYQSSMSLKELASISVADPHTLVVSPWDKSILEEIERAISTADLNLHPQPEADLIRIKIPQLTEETRKDLVKLVHQKLESGRRLLRQIRNEAKNEIEEQEGQPGVSEDDIKKWLDDLQELIDQFNERLEALGEEKETELMKI